MPLMNKIKYAISTKFGGDSSDWENISETKKDIFTVREFKNKNTNEIITSIIGWKDEEYESRWYFKEDYQPDKAFVIDIANTDNGLKIVELNCINCSGFYEADIQKIIMNLNMLG